MAEVDLSKKVADRYLKREVLGEGTYGVVYKAIDTKVNPSSGSSLISYLGNFFLFLRVVCDFVQLMGRRKTNEN